VPWFSPQDNKRAPNGYTNDAATLAGVSEKKLRLDAVYANCRECLAMTLFAAIPFSAFVFENNDFLALSLGHDLSVNRNPVYIGLADLDIITVGKYKDLIESDRRPDVTGEFFNPENVTFLYPILFTACGNHCVHVSALL
jgi:hypothetical protein